MYGSMADIQSATAEITRGKHEDRKKKIEETTGQNIMSASATQGGHKNVRVQLHVSRYMKIDKCSAVAEMGDRLATIDIGRKFGACAPFWGRGRWVPT